MTNDRPREVSVFEPVRWAKSVPLLLRGNGTPDTTAHHVLLVMATFADPDGTNIRPSMATLTKESHLTKQSTTTKALRSLEQAGLIVRTGELTGGTVVWKLNYAVRGSGDDFEHRQEQARKSNAERQRRFRQAKKTEDAAGSPHNASVERDVTPHWGVTEEVSNAPVERYVTPQSGVSNAPVRRHVTPQSPSQPQVTPATPALDLPLDLPLTVGAPPAGATAPSAQPIVGAWYEAFKTATGRRPNQSMRGQVGKEAAQLLAEGEDPALVLEAAESVGAKGYSTLEREFNPMAARRRNGNGRSNSGHRPWTNHDDPSEYSKGWDDK